MTTTDHDTTTGGEDQADDIAAAIRDHVRAVLLAERKRQDQRRATAIRMEAIGFRLVRVKTPASDFHPDDPAYEDPEGPWAFSDWRTGAVTTSGSGVQARRDAWQPDMMEAGNAFGDWNWRDRELLPAGIMLPGLPASLSADFGEPITEWVTSAYDADRHAEVAAVAGWTLAEVQRCLVSDSYPEQPGNDLMRAGGLAETRQPAARNLTDGALILIAVILSWGTSGHLAPQPRPPRGYSTTTGPGPRPTLPRGSASWPPPGSSPLTRAAGMP